MKLSTLLNVTIETKVNITDRSDNNYEYKIDYLKNGLNVEKYGLFEIHPTRVTIPDNILKKTVEYVETNHTTHAVEITIK